MASRTSENRSPLFNHRIDKTAEEIPAETSDNENSETQQKTRQVKTGYDKLNKAKLFYLVLRQCSFRFFFLS